MRPAQPQTFYNKKMATPDTNLMELLVPPIKAGNLTAYKPFDCNFSQKWTLFEVNDSGVVCHGEDSETVVDPATNIEKRIYVDRSPHLERIHKYGVLEDWFFDPVTARIQMQIIGIGPRKEIIVDSVYRGIQTMFWIKYADASEVLAHYDKLHPTKTFASLIWEDYFYSDVKPKQAK